MACRRLQRFTGAGDGLTVHDQPLELHPSTPTLVALQSAICNNNHNTTRSHRRDGAGQRALKLCVPASRIAASHPLLRGRARPTGHIPSRQATQASARRGQDVFADHEV
jgi:hypothetical protein